MAVCAICAPADASDRPDAGRADRAVVAAVALSVFLYNLGSPVSWYEDQVHVAIVRRLSELASPRLDNIYVTPGIVYTYPFPGTHYFMALVAKLSDIDAAVRLSQASILLGARRARDAPPGGACGVRQRRHRVSASA